MNLEVKLNDLLKSTSWNSAPYIGLRALLDQVIGPHTPSDTTSPYAKTPLLLDLFDPSRPYPVLQPLQAVIACLNNLNNQEHLDGIAAGAKTSLTPADGGVPNAELVMPVLQSVFEGGALSELFCLIDTLLYGCASGPQPACPSGSTSP
jgi:hypothetical protein